LKSPLQICNGLFLCPKTSTFDIVITILTPFRNAEPYFAECIQSILDQTYENWELILVDDDSTDESQCTALSFQAKDARIHLYKNDNPGLIQALRLAFSKSSGQFITRMDADDIMPPNKLMDLRHVLVSKGNKHVAVGFVKYFSEQTLGEGYTFYENWLNTLTQQEDNYKEIYRECVIPSPNFLIHKADLESIDAFNPSIYPEDYDLAFRMYKNDFKVVSTNSLTHYWRDHQNRSTRTQAHYQILNFIPLKVKHFVEIDYNSSKTLVLWGAAKKGKLIARQLIERKIPFKWVTENPQRIGHNVYDVIIEDGKDYLDTSDSQVILAVSNRKEQEEIVGKVGEDAQVFYFF
jgi:glycosyltransferase involved in cell wall biosynthesis